jgi:hypothetical protein
MYKNEHIVPVSYGTPFFQRLIRAAKLDASLYEEVESDSEGLSQAITVVALSSLATGIGAFPRLGARGLLFGMAVGLIGWVFWSFLTYWIGARLLPTLETNANLGQLLRTTGFATAPGILGVLGYAPALTGFITVITQLWVLAAFVIAIRQALDYTSTLRAIAVCAIGWVIYVGAILMFTT